MSDPSTTEDAVAVVELPGDEIPFPLPPELLPKVDHLITEDDTPVDNIFSEKQQRLLVEPLHTSWHGGPERQKFVALSNVAMFAVTANPPLVPDAFVSMDVSLPDNLMLKKNRSYFYWEYGPPDVVIEIVSNTEGNELGSKLRDYARMRVLYYVVFDPEQFLKSGLLNVFVLNRKTYEKQATPWFPEVGLGLKLWEGKFEDTTSTWLRWCDHEGTLILTGFERAEAEAQRAEAEAQRAEAEAQRANNAEAEVAKLKARLRELGIEP
jgi:Uma2 family endonuclease